MCKADFTFRLLGVRAVDSESRALTKDEGAVAAQLKRHLRRAEPLWDTGFRRVRTAQLGSFLCDPKTSAGVAAPLEMGIGLADPAWIHLRKGGA